MKKLITYGTVGLLIFLAACSEAPIGQTPVNKTPPSPLSNVQVESIPGGGKFTYDLPNEEDISYVQADYMYRGKEYTVYSSIYNSYLIVEGLGDTMPLEVSLRVVNHSQVASTAVTKSFSPDTPPIDVIFESFDLVSTFGGVAALWTNATETEIGIRFFVEENGVLIEYNTVFSKEIDGNHAFRGLPNEENLFAVQIFDKWGNESEVKEKRLTPLLEKLLDKSKFLEMKLPGDNTSTQTSRPLSNMWDGSIDVIWHTQYPYDIPFPHYVGIDLGVEAIISRVRLWTRPTFYYSNYSWKTFEIWGAKSYPADMSEAYWTGPEHGGTGAWKDDGWMFLADCEIKRPSGDPSAIGSPTGEDLAAAQAGFDFEISLGAPSVRYLRFVVKTIWSGGYAMHMGEINIYGDDNL